MADAHWGRWKTIFIASILAIIGHALLIVSSLPTLLATPKTALAVLLTGIVIMVRGICCILGSCVAHFGRVWERGRSRPMLGPQQPLGQHRMALTDYSTLMAEQTAHHKPKIKVYRNGKRVIVDPELTVSRSYLYLYLMLNIAAVAGAAGELIVPTLEKKKKQKKKKKDRLNSYFLGMVYAEKLVGFWLAYVIPLAFFFMAPWVLLWGRKRYIRSPPSGSVLSQTIKLLGLATRGQWSLNPVQTYKNPHPSSCKKLLTSFSSYKNLSKPDILERVKPSNIRAEQRPLWMTFPDSWVDEVERGLKACQVLSWYPILCKRTPSALASSPANTLQGWASTKCSTT
jgi:POT family proton-dependent oligopeptide transporter